MQAQLQILVAPSVYPAKLERIVLLLVTARIAMLVNTVKAKKTTVLPVPMLPFALVALLVGRPKPVVLNVNLAKQELSIMLRVKTVKIAMLANTVQAKKTTV